MSDTVTDLEHRVGAEVRRLREAKGWTQDRLARALTKLGTPATQSTVTRIEKGARPLRLNEAEALARALGVAIEGLWRAPTPVMVEISELQKHVGLLKGLAAQAVEMAQQRDEALAKADDWQSQAARHQERLSQHLTAIADLRRTLEQVSQPELLKEHPELAKVMPQLLSEFEAEYGQPMRELMATNPVVVEF